MDPQNRSFLEPREVEEGRDSCSSQPLLLFALDEVNRECNSEDVGGGAWT